MSREYEAKRLIPPPLIRLPAHLVYEGFEYIKKISAAGIGDDYIARKNPEYAITGNYSLEMKTRFIDAAIEDEVMIYLRAPVFPNPKITTAITFVTTKEDREFYVESQLRYAFNSKDTFFLPQVRIRMDTGVIQVLDADDHWQPIETLGDIGSHNWTLLTMTVNFHDERYDTVMVGNYSIDASAHKIKKVEGFIGMTTMVARIENITITQAHIYLDNLFVEGTFK